MLNYYGVCEFFTRKMTENLSVIINTCIIFIYFYRCYGAEYCSVGIQIYLGFGSEEGFLGVDDGCI